VRPLLPALDFYRDGTRNRTFDQADLLIDLATLLYGREIGDPSSPRALVGPYLKSLPEGYVEPAPVKRPPPTGTVPPP
jgi:hypothetical protein